MSDAAALREDLEALARIAPEAGVLCDFDGCLAPIVSDPAAARALPEAGPALARLARRFAVVAVISGRGAADLRARLHVPGVRLLGLYGLEEASDDGIRVAPEAEAARAAVEEVTARLAEALATEAGVFVERKGPAVAVHYRRAPDPDDARRRVDPLVREVVARAATGDEEALSIVPGRRVVEVRPRAGGDKGDAVRRLVETHRLRGALAGGDDTGDRAVFDALASLPLAVRVAVASDESPPGLLEAADYTVDGPEAFVALLTTFADAADS